MISVLTRAADRQEEKRVVGTLKTLAAKLTEEEWNIFACGNEQDVERLPEDYPLIDLACCDVTQEDDLEWTEHFRRLYRESRLMLIADAHISPVRYLRPQIMASSLLLRPYSPRQLAEVAEEFIRAYLVEEQDEDKCLIIKSRDGQLVIPYGQIYYLEAREKKIFVRVRREEYALYDTLENLDRALPAYFVRTHRSFLVNSRMIKTIRLSDHLVLLQDGFSVPLSRGYRAGLKEWSND